MYVKIIRYKNKLVFKKRRRDIIKRTLAIAFMTRGKTLNSWSQSDRILSMMFILGSRLAQSFKTG